MPRYEDDDPLAGTEAGLPLAEGLLQELQAPERDPGELHAEMLHMTGAADRRPAPRREGYPGIAALRGQLGV